MLAKIQQIISSFSHSIQPMPQYKGGAGHFLRDTLLRMDYRQVAGKG